MDKIKRVIYCSLHTSICNFRCDYCYISHRRISYEGKQADFLYSPEYVGEAFSQKRLGGVCFFNFCARGETLITQNIDAYVLEIVKQGHYAEIVTNMTITPMINKILAWDKDLLARVTFKCSFHYLELVKRNLLQTFANNVNNAWQAGASASVEITPSDELIPYIPEVIEFSLKNFGAKPQLTIARDDATGGIEYLTNLTKEAYENTWRVFDSPFWRFKQSIFKVKREEYCYSGVNTLFVNLANGNTRQCYISRYHQNIFKDLKRPIKFLPICKCTQPHCYNGHALLTMSNCVPGFTDVLYGDDIRDRVKTDGTHWIQPQMLEFMNGRVQAYKEYEMNLGDQLLLHAGDIVSTGEKVLRGLMKKK